jgi:hypothetical protein
MAKWRAQRHEGASKKGPSNLNKCSHPTEPLIPPLYTTGNLEE